MINGETGNYKDVFNDDGSILQRVVRFIYKLRNDNKYIHRSYTNK